MSSGNVFVLLGIPVLLHSSTDRGQQIGSPTSWVSSRAIVGCVDPCCFLSPLLAVWLASVY